MDVRGGTGTKKRGLGEKEKYEVLTLKKVVRVENWMDGWWSSGRVERKPARTADGQGGRQASPTEQQSRAEFGSTKYYR
jgi:hypothetical protein